MIRLAVNILIALVLGVCSLAQAQETGLIVKTPEAQPGYTLFSPIGSTVTYLIDINGNPVHTWESAYRPGMAVYLTPSGQLLRACSDSSGSFSSQGGSGGRVQLVEPDGTIAWDYPLADSTRLQHHDLEYLPNGNILMIVWELIPAEKALAMGRNPDLLPDGSLWPDKIIEVRPEGDSGGEIVWEWRAWDHLVQDSDPALPNYGRPAANPGRIDLNYTTVDGADWTHTNSVAYDPDLDRIILSVRNFNEIWIIDHSTTTAEAASSAGGDSGQGGDLLYRWGNPAAHGADGAQMLFGQHDAQWVPSGYPGQGRVLVFNNGTGRRYSSVDELSPPLNEEGGYDLGGTAYGPDGLSWTYQADPPESMFSRSVSGAERMANGNTLICVGESGELVEVNPGGEVVWRYVNPYSSGRGSNGGGNAVFKVRRYGPDYPGIRALGLD